MITTAVIVKDWWESCGALQSHDGCRPVSEEALADLVIALDKPRRNSPLHAVLDIASEALDSIISMSEARGDELTTARWEAEDALKKLRALDPRRCSCDVVEGVRCVRCLARSKE